MLYLASSSERRHRLLRDAGIDYRPVRPGPEPDFAGSPREVAAKRATAKARGAEVDGAAGWVLGADTVVECAGPCGGSG